MNPLIDLPDLTDPFLSAQRPPSPQAPSAAFAPGSGEVHPSHRPNAAVRRGELASSPTGVGSGQDVSWPLPPSPSSVPLARHLAGAQLEYWGFGEHREIAELLISELVTNAVRYGDGQIDLTIHSRDGVLRFEVQDEDATTAPHMRHARDNDEGGRGLRLVALLSGGWGTAPTETGKTVWFELPVHRTPQDTESN